MHLELQDIAHSFRDDVYLFEHVNVTFLPGHVYALIGPSGSGKSTLLSIIAGFLTPTNGNVIKTDIIKIGWVFQNPFGAAKRTAIDHVALPFQIRGFSRISARARAHELMQRFQLDNIENSPFSALSGGEGQRLMLARGIAAEPSVLLVDEPTAQLDQMTTRVVNDSLKEIGNDNVIVIIATHDEDTKAVCTDVVDLREYSSN
jgi:ABC-type lipoprotein export system ATPase subunit